jgi:VWFA-related protein
MIIIPLGQMRSFFARVFGLLLLFGIAAPLSAQSQEPETASVPQKTDKPAAGDKNEVVTSDTPAIVKLRVNVVLVRVVVRDAHGKPIPNLKKEDFQLSDNRKPQVISTFAVETPASRAAQIATDSKETSAAAGGAKAAELPSRFVALFFDDLHLAAQDVILSRQAATKLLATLQPSDRFGIFASSGQLEQDFTADREKLSAAIQRISPRGISSLATRDCPPMTFYEAYLIWGQHDIQAMQLAIQDAVACGIDPRVARTIVESAAQRELTTGESEVQVSFANLNSLIRRMRSLPGPRSIVMMSPGFFVTPSTRESSEVIDRATRANIVINSVDARGLFVSGVYDVSSRLGGNPLRQTFMTQEEHAQDDVLAELADGTGGQFIHNRNDIDQGVMQVAAQPEVSYILGFSPQNLKLDGKYHQLKVTLANKEKLAIQARHGYFAPAKALDPETAAKQEMQEAVFSRDELHDLAMDCETQFFKNGNTVHLTVLARIGIKGLQFRKEEDRNKENLTVAIALFDENGNLLKVAENVFELKLKDTTLETLKKTGIGTKSEFDVKPGTYLVRLVVRGSEMGEMAAMNRAVVIPQ